MSRSPRILTLCLIVLAVACRPAPEIDRERVEHLITVLAADDMEGRAAFTAGAERAAEFIRAEFEAIGLATLEGAADHLQRFAVPSREVQSLEVTLNGRTVADDATMARLGSDAIEWGPDHPVRIAVVGAEDNLMGTLQRLRRGREEVLVLVNSTHATIFERVRRFLGGAARALESDLAPSSVLVLTDETALNTYEVRATATTTMPELANVVGVINGRRADEIVLFSAHYDHIGRRQTDDGDAIANGANDDASGTTAVIELARYFKALGEPERTLVFVGFTAEEMGGYGARYFSSRLDPDQIVAMFNIEMIGKAAEQGPGAAWITGFERSDFGAILQAATEGTAYSFHADPYPEENLFFRSDNVTLARLGVPAHTISTTPIVDDPDYHRVTDEVDTLDLDHMTDTIRGIAIAARSIIDGEATPTRIDAAAVER